MFLSHLRALVILFVFNHLLPLLRVFPLIRLPVDVFSSFSSSCIVSSRILGFFIHVRYALCIRYIYIDSLARSTASNVSPILFEAQVQLQYL